MPTLSQPGSTPGSRSNSPWPIGRKRPSKPRSVGSTPTQGARSFPGRWDGRQPPKPPHVRSTRTQGANVYARSPTGRGAGVKPRTVRVRIPRRVPTFNAHLVQWQTRATQNGDVLGSNPRVGTNHPRVVKQQTRQVESLVAERPYRCKSCRGDHSLPR